MGALLILVGMFFFFTGSFLIGIILIFLGAAAEN